MSPTGAIKFYSEMSGYGFIEWQGEDAFSHVSEIQDESAEDWSLGTRSSLRLKMATRALLL